MLMETVLKTVFGGVLPRLTKAFCKAICRALFVIKSEEVPQLLVVSAMSQCRVGDNRNALSGAGALASDGSGLSETTRLDCLRSRQTISVVFWFREHSIRVVKLLRAHGGCLGVRRL